MKPSRGQIETMVEQLAQRSELFVRMEALLEQVSSEQTGSLDQAEEAVVKQLRALGQEALSVGMRERAAGIEAPPRARRGVKKIAVPDDTWVDRDRGTDVEERDANPASGAAVLGSESASMFTATAAGADRLRSGRGLCSGSGEGA
jgi:hypothetical protein